MTHFSNDAVLHPLTFSTANARFVSREAIWTVSYLNLASLGFFIFFCLYTGEPLSTFNVSIVCAAVGLASAYTSLFTSYGSTSPRGMVSGVKPILVNSDIMQSYLCRSVGLLAMYLAFVCGLGSWYLMAFGH